MPLFQIENQKIKLVHPKNFNLEKDIQHLVEQNLDTVFNCKFIASEFPTGSEHAGRIDTLALSEDNNPVIIEYKKVESSELVNQSLYYLSWIQDHKGDFTVMAQKALGKNVEIDWTDVRVICIAPGYKKYDLHAVQMMGANIELWQYRLFNNETLYLEEITRRNLSISSGTLVNSETKNPVMVAAGKKAAITRATGTYAFNEHLSKSDETRKQLLLDIRDYCLNLEEAVEEVPKKLYIAYKIAQNFVCIDVRKDKLILALKIDPTTINNKPSNARDVSNIGHYGTGDFEITVRTKEDLEVAFQFIKKSFENVGG